jgi:WD40 repeat protein/serine/threonine protein kinase
MSERPAADRSWIDDAASRFEKAWEKGLRPRIEHFLEEVDESRWPPLLTELLRVESKLRRQAGEQPSRDEYSRGFAEHTDLIEAIFGPAGASPTQRKQAMATGLSRAQASPASSRESSLPPELRDNPDYEISRELGHGGMGVVYLAYNHLMGRDEVLKVISREIIELPGALDRFLREIRAVGRLRHPNIVTAYTAFRAGEGLVFAMEYAEGLDLARMVKAKGPMPVGHACYFIHQAALGLQHAHEKGMVHRDIKPSNLMLSHQGNHAVIKLLDFGLAKASSEQKVIDFRRVRPSFERDTVGNLTRTGQMLGTPDFIAPEQIVDAQHADIRADIYSLGCTLYYLLSGRPPFQAASVYDVLQAHRSTDAPRLCLVRPEVPANLSELVAGIMAKDPNRRIQTPAEVAKVLIQFFKRRPETLSSPNLEAAPAPPGGPFQLTLAGMEAEVDPARAAETEPALNRSASMWSSLIEFKETDDDWARDDAGAKPAGSRPRWLSAAVGALLLVGGLITVWSAGLLGVKPANRRLGFDELRKPQDLRGAAKKPAVQPPPGERPSELSGSSEKRSLFVEMEKDRSERADEKANVGTGEAMSNGERVGLGAAPELRKMPSPVAEPTGRTEATTPKPDTASSARTFYEIASINTPDPVIQARLVTDEKHVLFETHGTDRALWFGELADRQNPRRLECNISGWAHMALSSDGKFAVLVGKDKALWTWDLQTGQSRRLNSERVDLTAIALSPDNQLVAYVRGGAIQVCNANTGAKTKKKEFTGKSGNRIDLIAFSGDGRRIVSTHADSTIRLWDAETGRQKLLELHASVGDPAIVPDGRHLLRSCADGMVGVWNMETGQQLKRFSWLGDRRPASIAVSPDGRRALFGTSKLLLLWDLETGEELRRIEHGSETPHVGFSPDGRRAVSSANQTVRVWTLPPGRLADERPTVVEIGQFLGHQGTISNEVSLSVAAVSPNGRWLLAGGWYIAPIIWDRQTGRLIRQFEDRGGGTMRLKFSPEGLRVFSSGWDNIVRLWDVESGQQIREFGGQNNEEVKCLAVSPDGRLVYSAGGKQGGSDFVVHVWNVETGQEAGRLAAHEGSICSLALSPDGRRLLSGGDDKTVILWDTRTGALVRRFAGHTRRVECVAMLSDSRRFVSACRDEPIRLWDIESGQELLRFAGDQGGAFELAVSPDGRRLIAADHNPSARELRLWTIDTGQLIQSLRYGDVWPGRGTFTGDGRHAVWPGADGIVRLYLVAAPDGAAPRGPRLRHGIVPGAFE